MITDQKKTAYSKTWTSASDFPTYEADESQVRTDMQYLYEEIRVWLNAVLDAMSAGQIPFTRSAGVPADTIQAAIDNVKSQLDSAVISGIVPDNSITAAKLKDYCVTTAKLDNQAVTSACIRQNTIGKGLFTQALRDELGI